MSSKPLKRHPGLQALSREHHQGLIVALNVDKGVKKNIEIDRIAKYIIFQFNDLLIPHFEFEEREVFNFLPKENKLRNIALEQHDELRKTVQNMNSLDDCIYFARLLRKHIRFEERELFELIQEHVDPDDLIVLENKWSENLTCVNWEDPFWK